MMIKKQKNKTVNLKLTPVAFIRF